MDLETLRADIKRRLGRPTTTGGGAFARGMANTTVDNLMGAADLPITAMAPGAITADLLRPREAMEGGVPNFGPIDVLGRAVRGMTGGAVDPVAAGQRYAQDPVRMGDRVLGLPRGEQVVSGALAGKDFVTGANFNPVDAYRGRMAESQQMGEEHPIATSVGGVAGDVATILTGRMPFAAGAGKSEKALATWRRLDLDPGFRRTWDRFLKSDSMKSLFRGTGRAAETGIEAATLSVLKEGDPLEAAAYGAGAQMAGSGALSLLSSFLPSGKVMRELPVAWKLAGGAAAASTLYATLSKLTPVGQGNIFDAIEATDAGYTKVAAALALGVTATAAGTGRIRSADLPKIGDAITSIPRGALISLLTDLANEEKADGSNIKRTIEHMAADPTIFNDTQQKRLSAALDEGGDFARTVSDMVAKDPRFKAVIATTPRNVMEETESLRESIKQRLGLAPKPEGMRHQGR